MFENKLIFKHEKVRTCFYALTKNHIYEQSQTGKNSSTT
jgi:hypothetical protein